MTLGEEPGRGIDPGLVGQTRESLTRSGFLVPQTVEVTAAQESILTLDNIDEEFQPFAAAGISAIVAALPQDTDIGFLEKMAKIPDVYANPEGLPAAMDQAIPVDGLSDEAKQLLSRGIITVNAAQAASFLKNNAYSYTDVGEASQTETYELPLVGDSARGTAGTLLSEALFANIPLVAAVQLRYQRSHDREGLSAPIMLSFATPPITVAPGRTISGFSNFSRIVDKHSGQVALESASGTIRDGLFPYSIPDPSFDGVRAFSQITHMNKSH